MDQDDDVAKTGAIKDKLIRTKEEWARQGRLLTGQAGDPARDRLPPGQRQVNDWPVLDLGVQPDISLSKWRLGFHGAVDNPQVWTWQDFLDQPQVDKVSDIHCVTQWSRFDNRWQGVAAQHILATVRPKPEARHVIFHSYDGYTTNVRLEAFADEDVLLAHSWEGQPLTREHGGPVRVVIPRYYFWKSPKWVSRIEFSAVDKPGFWEERGYHNEGDPWKEDRYS